MPEMVVSVWEIDEHYDELIKYIIPNINLADRSYTMELNENTFKLISFLEFLIASHCYNPNSYDGWHGMEGAAFRYPLTFPAGDMELRTRREVYDASDFNSIEDMQKIVAGMKYKFGSNHLYIGEAIIDLLSTLEDRYGISFSELEEKFVQSMKDKEENGEEIDKLT